MSDSIRDIEERQNRFELSALLETTRLLIESYDLDFVLNHLLLILMGKLLITRGAILIYDHDNFYKVVKIKGPMNMNENDIVELPDSKELREGLFHEMGPGELKVLPCTDVSNAQHIIVTLKTSNQHIGFLCLGPKATKSPLSPREKDFLQTLTVMASVAIYNSELFEDLTESNRNLDRKVQELHTLFDISKEFNLTVDREQIVRIFKFALLGQMFVRTFFFIMEHNGKRSIIAQNGIRYKPTQSEINSVFKSFDSSSFYNDGLSNDTSPFIQKNNIHLIVPLYIQDKKTALIGVGPRGNNEDYTETDGNFLVSLGNLTIMSIQKTWLLEERIEKERMEKELGIARTIQEGLFPANVPALPGLDIAARNIPSRQVGGDYYDFVPDDDSNLTIAIGDVTGKGVPASLIMANMQALLHTLTPLDLPLEIKTGRMNDIIYKNTPSDTFVTFFWGYWDLKSRIFHYINAGHNPPLVFHQDSNKPDSLTTGGLILGAVPTLQSYQSDDVSFREGDILVLYTDGVTEARNSEDEEYEEERLIACVNKHKQLPSSDILSKIVNDVIHFSDNNIADDLTLIVIKVT